jgi:predicted amidohydrolase YtcJ
MPADAAYTGGPIDFVDQFQPHVAAIAVGGGRNVAAGYRDEVIKKQGAHTRPVDLGRRTFLPDFVDPYGDVFDTDTQAI